MEKQHHDSVGIELDECQEACEVIPDTTEELGYDRPAQENVEFYLPDAKAEGEDSGNKGSSTAESSCRKRSKRPTEFVGPRREDSPRVMSDGTVQDGGVTQSASTNSPMNRPLSYESRTSSSPLSVQNFRAQTILVQTGSGNVQNMTSPVSSTSLLDYETLQNRSSWPYNEDFGCCAGDTPIGSLTSYGREVQFPRNHPRFLSPGRDHILCTMWELISPKLTDLSGKDQDRRDAESASACDGHCGIIGVTSAGGYGKSMLAIKFIKDHSDDFTECLWVDASTETELLQNFAKLATFLDLEDAASNTVIRNAELVSRWLQKNSKWLLVFDGANDENILRELAHSGSYQVIYLAPENRNGCVIVTSRATAECLQEILGIEEPIQLKELEDKEVEQYLLQRLRRNIEGLADDKEKVALRNIAHDIGGMPLKIERCAAYIQRRKYSFHDFFIAATKRGDYPVQASDDRLKGIEESLEKDFAAVQEKSITAYFVLCIASFLNEHDIPYSLFQHGYGSLKDAESFSEVFAKFSDIFTDTDVFPESKESDGNEEIIFKDVLYHIRKRSLISYTVHADSFSILKDAQRLMRKRIRTSRTYEHFLRATVTMLVYIFDTRPADIQIRQLLLPHAFKCLERVDNKCSSLLFTQYCKLKLETSLIQATLNRFDQADDIADSLTKEITKFSDSPSPELRRLELKILCHRAQLMRWQGKLNESSTLMRMCEQMADHVSIKSTEDEADMCRWMANVLIDEHKLTDAKYYLDRAENIYLQVPSAYETSRQRNVAHLKSLYGRLYKKCLSDDETLSSLAGGRNEAFAMAQKYYTEACEMTSEDDYRHHTYKAALAEVQFRRQISPCIITRTFAARRTNETLSSALHAIHQIFGESHRFCAWIKKTRTLIMMEIGEELDEALRDVNIAIQIYCHIYGPQCQNQKLASCYFIKGEILRKLKRFEEGREALLKAKESLPHNIPYPLTPGKISDSLNTIDQIIGERMRRPSVFEITE